MVKGRMTTKLGDIEIEPEVIAKYAGCEAMEVVGIVGMAGVSMKDGLVRLLKRESVTKGIQVEVEDNRLILDFHVIVAYGVNIGTIENNLRERVRYKVEEYTGLEVGKINIYVEGVRIID